MTAPMSPQRKARKAGAARPRPPGVSWLLTPLLIALVTFAAFLPTLGNQFVNWDDGKNLLDNPHYRGLGWTQLRWMWTTFHMGHYIPLTWMTLGLDYLLWGMQPLGYHLTSLLLHAANAVVFYFVAARLLGLAVPHPGDAGHLRLAVSAGFAALLFALHPLRVESVAWATERRDVLSGLFYLLTLLVYLRACEREERYRWWYAGSVALFVCALLSKSMAVSLPVVLLIVDVYPLRRLGGARGWGRSARLVYLEKIPFVVLALAASAIAFLALTRLQNMSSLDDLSVPDRLAVSAYGLSFYLWKTVAPMNLSPLYELRAVNSSATAFLLSYGAVLTLTALAWVLRRRVPGLPAAWLAYVVILFPVLGLFQNGPQIVADRYAYLAGLGGAIWAGAGLFHYWSRLSFFLPGAALCILLGLAALTWTQAQVWHNSERLWTHALAIDPNSPVAENHLGAALARQGNSAEAIDHYRQALKIRPAYAEAHSNLGHALAEQGRLAQAIEHFREALKIRPGYAEAHNDWGLALARQGKLPEAIEHYQQGLRITPDHPEIHYNLGHAAAEQGRLAQAIQHYEQAVKINPDFADALNNWGAALARQGKLAEAIERYREALRITPDHANAHYNWGLALAQQGKLAEAIEHYQQALRITPDHAGAHSNLGLALLRQGKMVEALHHFQQALRSQPPTSHAQSDPLDTLLRQGTGGTAPSRTGKRPE
jgi:tetratricopeptide (TPR) repeat protein